MAMFDTDRSGTIGIVHPLVRFLMCSMFAGFQEFTGLWQYIKDWFVQPLPGRLNIDAQHSRQNVFRHFDKDRSGSIEGNELKDALAQFGYNLNPQLLQLLERKYGRSPICSYYRTMLNSYCPWGAVHDSASAAPAPGHGPYGQVRSPGITFDRFVRCCVVVRQLTESFQRSLSVHIWS